jgi:hypothetical protein
MGVAIYYESFDYVFVGRLVRSLCSFICLYGFCIYFSNYCLDEKIGWLLNVLMVHAVIVIISATVFVELQEYLKWFTDYTKQSRMFRSTGLMVGFDMSGLICNIGVILVLTRSRFNLAKFIVFVVAVLFTSRFSIISLFFILTFYIILMNKEIGKLKFISISIPLLFAGIAGFVLISLTTSNFISNTMLSSKSFSSDFVERLAWTYARSDLYQTRDMYFVFPGTFLTLLFGLGFYGGTDPGYVRIINCVGVVGLVSIVLWHVYLIFNFFSIRLKNPLNLKQSLFIGSCFSLVLLCLNLKNSYFFTGTFFEIMLYVFYCYMFESKKRS